VQLNNFTGDQSFFFNLHTTTIHKFDNESECWTLSVHNKYQESTFKSSSVTFGDYVIGNTEKLQNKYWHKMMASGLNIKQLLLLKSVKETWDVALNFSHCLRGIWDWLIISSDKYWWTDQHVRGRKCWWTDHHVNDQFYLETFLFCRKLNEASLMNFGAKTTRLLVHFTPNISASNAPRVLPVLKSDRTGNGPFDHSPCWSVRTHHFASSRPCSSPARELGFRARGQRKGVRVHTDEERGAGLG